MGPGRPRKAENKAELPEKPLQPKQATVPKIASELPKEIIGSHMGHYAPTPATGPVIKNPAKLGPRLKKGPAV